MLRLRGAYKAGREALEYQHAALQNIGSIARLESQQQHKEQGLRVERAEELATAGYAVVLGLRAAVQTAHR